MGLIGNALRSLRKSAGAASKRYTPAQVREMISQGKLIEASAAVKVLAEDIANREVQALCLQGEIAFHERRDEEALEFFKAAAAQAPGLSEAHYGLSLVLHAKGELDSALRHAQFAANNGTHAALYAQLGLCHVEMKNYVQADNALSRATRLDPSDKYAWNNLGIALHALGYLPRARAAFERAVALDPQFQQAKEHAHLLSDSSAPSDDEVAKPVRAEADELPICEALKRVRDLAQRQELTAALDGCESLLAERPDDVAVAVEMYELYRATGDAQSGIDVLEAFRARHPGDVQIIARLGRALVQAQEFKLAKPLVAEALERRPDDVPLLLAMAAIRDVQKRFADAGALLERAYKLQPSIRIKGLLADAWISQCRYAEALALSDEIIAEDSSD